MSDTATRGHLGNAADVCRANGWGVGTLLIGDEGYGPTVIQITALGESKMLARQLCHAGRATARDESSWVLWCRDWREADPDEVVQPLRPGSLVFLDGHPQRLVGTIESGPTWAGQYVVDCGSTRWMWTDVVAIGG